MKQAQYADLLKEAETERLIRVVQPPPPNLWQAIRKARNWLGNQLVKWGTKLQQYSPQSLPEVVSKEV